MTTTPFVFKIRKSARESWNIVIKHGWFFVGMGLISTILSFTGGERTPWIISLILGIASMVWTMIYLQVGLAAARGQEEKLTFKALRSMMPTVMDVLRLIGIGLLSGLFVLCGLILLIIPGAYVAIRLSFASLAYFDRKEGVRASVRYSWRITKGRVWTIWLTALFSLLILLGGLLALVIGLLIAAPIARVLMAKLYVALSDQYNNSDAVVVQPVEIPSDLPEVQTTT